MKTCTRCRRNPGVHDWTLEACASDKTVRGTLCHECDIDLNDMMLSMFRVRGKTKMMEAYRDKLLPKSDL